MLSAAILAAILVPRLAYAGCETILTSDPTKVAKAGDTMTGAFVLQAPFTMTGASSYATFSSSVTGNFFGNGHGLEGVVLKTGSTMSGSLAIHNSTLTVNGPIASSGTTGGGQFSGAGTRFEWIPAKAALRAGRYASTEADPASVGDDSFASGAFNTASGASSVVAGGTGNSATAAASTVCGGQTNSASNNNATVAGGTSNSASGIAGAIGGGSGNTNRADYGVIGGGLSNEIRGTLGVVPGGSENLASGSYSFAAGFGAKANAAGSLVWADSNANSGTAATLTSNTTDQFLVRAAGGFLVKTTSLSVVSTGGTALFSVDSTSISFPAGTLADSVIYGQDIALSTITPNKINTAGASSNDVLTFNGTQAVWTSLPSSGFSTRVTTESWPSGSISSATIHPFGLSNSTATFTLAAQAWCEVTFTGSGTSGASHAHYAWLMVDGDYWPGWGAAFMVGQHNANANPTNLSIPGQKIQLAAGSHSVYLAGASSAGTLTIPPSGHRARIQVECIH